MSRYDGLIIPRSYSEYINKTDAATLSQALQLSGVLSGIVAAGDNKAVKSDAVANIISEKLKYNYCFIPQSSGETKYVKITLNRKDWGFDTSDYYGFIMTYYNGYEFYINARNGNVYPIGNYINTSNISYITGVYVDIGDKVTIYIREGGYRGFFVRFQGYFENMEVSSIEPQGITFNSITYYPNS